MNCNQVQNKIIDYIDKNLPEHEMQEVEKHLDQCENCRDAVIETGKLFQSIEKNEDENPSPTLKDNFYQMLEQEKAAQNTETRPQTGKTKHLFNRSSLAIAAQIVLLLGLGFLGGYFANNSGGNEAQIAALQQQVNQLSQNLHYTSLNKPTASQRIKAINSIQTTNSLPNEKMIDALINTMNTDDNVNVRLTAIYALSDYSNSPKVKDALIESLEKQTDPILQITLINMVAGLNNEKSREVMRDIIENDNTNEQVKDHAKQTLNVSI